MRQTLNRVWLVGPIVIVSVFAVASPAHAATSPSISVGDVSIVEGGTLNRVARLVVTLSEPATTTVSVAYEIVGGSATRRVDYNARPTGTLNFVPGASGFTPVQKYISISVRGDSFVEGDESVLVQLSNPTPGYALGRTDGTATIIDDDPVTTTEMSIGDATIVEGDSGMRVLRFPVTLTQPSASPVFAGWIVNSGSATCAAVSRRQATVAEQDCGVLTNLVHPANTLHPLFPNGPTPIRTGIPGPTGVSKSLDFAIFPDRQAEGDEQFTVTLVLLSSVGVVLGRSVATGTIIDDD